ncbi:L-arabinokinase [Tanacetum coccineum]
MVEEGYIDVTNKPRLGKGFAMITFKHAALFTTSTNAKSCTRLRAAAAFTANLLWVVNTRLQVENSVIGAPCRVMDQMASACGEANKLLTMVCQRPTYGNESGDCIWEQQYEIDRHESYNGTSVRIL